MQKGKDYTKWVCSVKSTHTSNLTTVFERRTSGALILAGNDSFGVFLVRVSFTYRIPGTYPL